MTFGECLVRILLQRVSEASVTVDNEVLGTIARGLLMFVCAEDGDTEKESAYLAAKVAKLRIFPDDNGKTNLSVLDVGGAALVVSQFTLAAEWRKGNRPGFSGAADAETGERLYKHFCSTLRSQGRLVETGRFGADMKVALVNDGPFTIWLDSRDPR